jgi:hypothetical protein
MPCSLLKVNGRFGGTYSLPRLWGQYISHETNLKGLQVRYFYRILGYHIDGYEELYLLKYNSM